MSAMAMGPAYTRLLSATALANLGDGIRTAALPLLAASLTTDPALVAGVGFAGQLPWLLFGLFAGAIIDRSDRRRLVAAVDAGRLLMLAVLLGAISLDSVSIVFIYAVAFVCGIGETVRDTAATTLVAPLVPPAALDRANGRLINAEIAGNEMIGPALGAYLFGVAVALPFAVNGSAYLVAAALVLSLPRVFDPPATPAPKDRNMLSEVVLGVRWLARHRKLRAVSLMGAVFAMADGAWFAILVLYVSQILRLEPIGFGVLIAVGAAGGLLGGFLAAPLARRYTSTVVLLGALGAGAVAQLLLGITADALLAAGALALSSFAFAVWNVVSLTMRQTLAPPHLHGRVIGSYRMLLMGSGALGALVGGVTASLFGLRVPLLLGVPALLLAGALGYRALRGPDEPPAATS